MSKHVKKDTDEIRKQLDELAGQRQETMHKSIISFQTSIVANKGGSIRACPSFNTAIVGNSRLQIRTNLC